MRKIRYFDDPVSIKKTNSGFTTFELVIAISMLTVCMVAFAQLVFSTSEYRQSRRMTQTAQDQLLNVMEMLDRVEPEKLKNLDFDKQPFEQLLNDTLPGGTIAFSVKPFTADEAEHVPADSGLLEVTVGWDVGEKRPSRALSIVKWVFTQPQEKQPTETEQQQSEEETP